MFKLNSENIIREIIDIAKSFFIFEGFFSFC